MTVSCIEGGIHLCLAWVRFGRTNGLIKADKLGLLCGRHLLLMKSLLGSVICKWALRYWGWPQQSKGRIIKVFWYSSALVAFGSGKWDLSASVSVLVALQLLQSCGDHLMARRLCSASFSCWKTRVRNCPLADAYPFSIFNLPMSSTKIYLNIF